MELVGIEISGECRAIYPDFWSVGNAR